MCYLCSQRAARNVPVYFREQEEKEERENAKILALAEQRKAEEEIQKEFQLKQAQRKITKEYAAFNKGLDKSKVGKIDNKFARHSIVGNACSKTLAVGQS